MLKFGKNKGRTIAELIRLDPKYLFYLGEQDWVDNATIEHIQMLIDRIILPFGKYAGKTINQLRNEDPSYLAYLFRDSRLN
jgi:uncharacterized protein (DUF3820 family)